MIVQHIIYTTTTTTTISIIIMIVIIIIIIIHAPLQVLSKPLAFRVREDTVDLQALSTTYRWS